MKSKIHKDSLELELRLCVDDAIKLKFIAGGYDLDPDKDQLAIQLIREIDSFIGAVDVA